MVDFVRAVSQTLLLNTLILLSAILLKRGMTTIGNQNLRSIQKNYEKYLSCMIG